MSTIDDERPARESMLLGRPCARSTGRFAVAAALCLNAFTLGMVTEPARNSERTVLFASRRWKSAGDIGES